MKRGYALLIMISCVMLLTACEKQELPSSEQDDMISVQGKTEIEVVDEEQYASEDDFRSESLKDGRCEIVSCSSTAKVIKVPETIYGETVVGIGPNAFVDVEAQKIILPDTVEYLKKNAFNTCEKLEQVELGSGLKRTDLFCFNMCNELRSVTFPEGMEKMTEVCFGICENLGEVYVPASVTEFGNKILSPALCKNAVIVTPAGSAAEANAIEYGIPVRNP